MAGTTIKGVGNSSNVQIPDLTTAAKQNAGTGFQAVWNKTQSSAQTANASTNNRNRTDRSDVRRGDSLKNGDRQRDNLVHSSDDKGMDSEKTDEKDMDMEKVQEVLGTIVQNLIGQITDTFSISEEELQGIMDDLGMTKMDLTDPASLNELLMNISGAQDSFALLTDENLYGNVKGIMNLQNELVGQAQEDLNVTFEEWQQTVAGIAQETVVEPVITVEMDDTVNTTAGSQTGEAAIPTQEPAILENQAAQNTQGEKAGDFGEKQEHAANGEHGNLLLQNLKEGNFLTQLQQTAQTEEAGPVDTQDIMRQIMDYMKVSVKPDSSDLEMQLHPQSLGTLHIQMAAKNGVITANFITENETVKAALESQMVQLKENFAEQGIKVEAIEVTVQTHPFEQNLEQGRDGNGSREAEAGVGRRRTRRINLNTAFAEDEPQTEEDRIAADIMSANGNTVDFTA